MDSENQGEAMTQRGRGRRVPDWAARKAQEIINRDRGMWVANHWANALRSAYAKGKREVELLARTRKEGDRCT
jgi:hypothetical protein